MTEKRFRLIEDDYSAWSIYDNATFPSKSLQAKEIVECLNNLHEEKEALELDNKLLLEEMKEIRDKLTVYLKVKGVE